MLFPLFAKVALVGFVLLALLLFGLSTRFKAEVFGEIETLKSMAEAPPTVVRKHRVDDTGVRLQQLPLLVRNYVIKALPDLKTSPGLITIHQTGKIRLNSTSRWMPFDAVEHFLIQEPGFVWKAEINSESPLNMAVLDSYMNGEGHLEGRFMDAVPLAKAKGKAMTKGELMRYLAELVWCPDAMLRNDALQWQEVDATTVSVTATEGDVVATVMLHFDDEGDIHRITAADRPRTVGSKTVDTRWSGTFSDYRTFKGYRIPTKGEVSWDLEDQTFIYWRGEVVDLGVEQVA